MGNRLGRGWLAVVVVGLLAVVWGERVVAQPCEAEWAEGVFGVRGVSGPGLVKAMAVFDDGSGPALYVGGEFTSAGGVPGTNFIARWDGSTWSPLGEGVGGGSSLPAVYSLAVFDDGTGPALYAGGAFTAADGVIVNRIARWDGSEWSALGEGVSSGGSTIDVKALTVFDDGNGPALYAGGNFSTAGGVAASRVARWDGTEWTPVGAGFDGTVRAFAAFDDGTGEALYAGGIFRLSGGVPVSRIARWDGTTWTQVGSGMNERIRALAVYDDGSGPALYAGGRFTRTGGVDASRVARWDGVAWTPLGSGLEGFGTIEINALAVFDDGSGQALFAGGEFMTAGGVAANRIGRWDGAAWTALNTGMDYRPVDALTVFDDGTGEGLYAGGDFSVAGDEPVEGIARWNGDAWAALGDGLNSLVRVLKVFDDGAGADLYAGGTINAAGGVRANRIARWDGSAWTPLGEGINGSSADVNSMVVFDDGAGPDLYVGGFFTTAGDVEANRIARWDGVQWTPVGTGTNNRVSAMVVFDDGAGPAIYGGGFFTTAGDEAASYIARWDGSAWTPVGLGMSGVVQALAVFDDGTGPALYAGGRFWVAGGAPDTKYIARWDGSAWAPLGTGLDGVGTTAGVRALAVFDDGSGPALYAGGSFDTAGGLPADNFARWDGSAWSTPGRVLSNVEALTVFDDGTGPALYAGGHFFSAGGVVMSNVARWDGLVWSGLGTGMSGAVHALTEFDDGSGLALFAGGYFRTAGDVPSGHVARWGCIAEPCRADIDGDGELTIFDFLGYQNLFDAGDLAADFDGDGELTIFDFLAFQNEFDAGCD